METTVGVLELPATQVFGRYGRKRHNVRIREALGSKQILGASLLDAGFNTALLDLRSDEEWAFGETEWAGEKITKVANGLQVSQLDPEAFEVWGLAVNYQVQQELACLFIKHLATKRPVIVGGVDPGLQPGPYLRAGASLIVRTRDGAANAAALDYVFGREPRIPLNGVIFADGRELPQNTFLHPEQWPLPPLWLGN